MLNGIISQHKTVSSTQKTEPNTSDRKLFITEKDRIRISGRIQNHIKSGSRFVLYLKVLYSKIDLRTYEIEFVLYSKYVL